PEFFAIHPWESCVRVEGAPEAPDPIRYFRPLFVPGLVFAALLLRLWHVRHGLPDFMEDAEPLRLALGLRDAATGVIDWNPHQFQHPSLPVYLHFFVQQAVFVAGRWIGAWHGYA